MFYVQLHAINEARNCRRAYAITVRHGLGDIYNVELVYGRIGARGRVSRYPFVQWRDVRRFVRQCLQRRRSAHVRIGAPYVVTAAYNAAFLYDVAPWLRYAFGAGEHPVRCEDTMPTCQAQDVCSLPVSLQMQRTSREDVVYV